ncbi:unnamed protein product [Symbiodinium sp. CCMP2456]|nr:unnamed protein product [Symbiodinium sp. CCMP2456]
MLTSARRLGVRRALALRAAQHGQPMRRQSFGYGDPSPPNMPGIGGEHQLHPPETMQTTAKYFADNMTNVPKYKEIIEGIGYPGQKHSAGGLCTLGRIYYGPGRCRLGFLQISVCAR